MNNPGVYDLGTRSVTANLADVVITSGVSAQGVAQAFIDRLDGMLACSIEARFIYGGSGGDTLLAVVETSLDQGATWIEVARFDFATAPRTKIVNLSGLTPKGVTTPSALSAEGVLDGFLGGRWRARLNSTGAAYGDNTSIALRLTAR